MSCKPWGVGGWAEAPPTVTSSPAIPNTEDYNTDYHTSPVVLNLRVPNPLAKSIYITIHNSSKFAVLK